MLQSVDLIILKSLSIPSCTPTVVLHVPSDFFSMSLYLDAITSGVPLGAFSFKLTLFSMFGDFVHLVFDCCFHGVIVICCGRRCFASASETLMPVWCYGFCFLFRVCRIRWRSCSFLCVKLLVSNYIIVTDIRLS